MLTKSGAKLLDFGLAKLGGYRSGRRTVDAADARRRTSPRKAPSSARSSTWRPSSSKGRKPMRAPTSSRSVRCSTKWSRANGRSKERARRVSLRPFSNMQPRTLSLDHPSIPRFLDHIIERCLAKSPDARWQSARDLCDELRWVARDALQTGQQQATVGARKQTAQRYPGGLLPRWQSLQPQPLFFICGLGRLPWRCGSTSPFRSRPTSQPFRFHPMA